MEIPGYVYDPSRKRYFRNLDHLPNNGYTNFTTPVKRLKTGQSSAIGIWVHPDIRRYSAPTVQWLLESSYRTPLVRRGICSTYHHRRLKVLQDPVLDRIEENNVFPIQELPGRVCASFDAVARPHLGENTPRMVFASKKLDSEEYILELRLVNMIWDKYLLRPSANPVFMSITRTNMPSLQFDHVGSVHLSSPSQIFLSCARYTPGTLVPDGQLVMINENQQGTSVRGMKLDHFQSVTAVNYQHGTVATSAGSPSDVLCLESGNDTNWKRCKFRDKSLIITSLDFHPTEKEYIFCGTAKHGVLFHDFRTDSIKPDVILRPESWTEVGITGNCQVTGITPLERYGFITTVAGLPEEAPKMTLWDRRNCSTPVTHFEEHFPFHKERLEISLSTDETRVVASDSTGLTRFWDTNTGNLVASISPSVFLEHFDSVTNCPPVSFYYDDGNRHALVIALRGPQPAYAVQNFRFG